MHNKDKWPKDNDDKRNKPSKQEQTTYGSISNKDKVRDSNGKQNTISNGALIQDAKNNQESSSLLERDPEDKSVDATSPPKSHTQASQLQEPPKPHRSLMKTICVYLFWIVICLLLALMFLRVVFYALYSTSRQSVWTWY